MLLVGFDDASSILYLFSRTLVPPERYECFGYPILELKQRSPRVHLTKDNKAWRSTRGKISFIVFSDLI